MIAETDLTTKLEKKEFQAKSDDLAVRFMRMQRRLIDLKIPALVVVEGWDAAGKGDVINSLMNRLDPRGARVTLFEKPTEEEALRPELWRFWNALPGRGQIALFDRSWYHPALIDRVEGGMKRKSWTERLASFRDLEATLAADGMVIVKLFLHISKKEQRLRFDEWESDKDTRWRCSKKEWRRHKLYEEYLEAAEEMLRRTHSPESRWHVVPATDRRYRRWSAGEAVLRALDEACKRAEAKPKAPKSERPDLRGENPIDGLDLKIRCPEARYRKEADELHERLRELQYRCYRKRRGVVIAFEGSDAAGKGGAIRRLTASLDPRGYSVVPIAAPQGDEASHHYLWRFWRKVPKAGHWTVFDRTWYGRVLVERVEGFCHPDERRRAYGEIRAFESALTESGIVLVKFWLQIDKDEQLKRFQSRDKDPDRKWKITPEDWRNREKWDAYREAVGDMVRLTAEPVAWTLVEAEDKLWARLKVLRTVSDAVADAL